jgi:SRSO17 transposase
MDLLESNASRLNFEAYINELVTIIGHADRAEPLHDYCTGLLLPGERKSVEPMAVLTKIRQIVLPKIEALGPIEAVIVDDTGFPKKGKHSVPRSVGVSQAHPNEKVGVARQYCGQLGKQDNCQAVVSLSLANHHASLPIAHRLYLPETWANDAERRKKAKVPEDVVFKTKPKIALDRLRAAKAAGLPLGTVLADAGYGNDSQFRDGVTQMGLQYAVGIQSNVLMWKADASLPVAEPDGQKPSRPATA